MHSVTALLIGIASSLIATGVFIALSELFRRVLIPLYKDHIYRGVRIDGEWVLNRIEEDELPENHEEQITLSLKQSGDSITGNIFGKTKGKADTNFKLSGSIRDGYFSATGWPDSSDGLDAVGCMFRIFFSKEKLRMKGKMLYMDSVEAKIVSDQNEMEFMKVG